MNDTCDRIQAALADAGVQALRGNPEDGRHVGGCEACAEVLFALQELDRELALLPEDAPPEGLDERVVAQLDAAPPAMVETAGTAPHPDGALPSPGAPPPPSPAPPVATRGRRRRWLLGAVALVLGGVGLLTLVSTGSRRARGPYHVSGGEDAGYADLARPGEQAPSFQDRRERERPEYKATAGDRASSVERAGRAPDNAPAASAAPAPSAPTAPADESAAPDAGAREVPQIVMAMPARRARRDGLARDVRGPERGPEPNSAPPPPPVQPAADLDPAGDFELPGRQRQLSGKREPATGDFAEAEKLSSSTGFEGEEEADDQRPEPVELSKRAKNHEEKEGVARRASERRDENRRDQAADDSGLLGALSILGATGASTKPDAPVVDLLSELDGLDGLNGLDGLDGLGGLGGLGGLDGDVGFRPDDAAGVGTEPLGLPREPTNPAEPWLAAWERLDVPTQEAAGYWSNTYLPGDPALRRIRGQLPDHLTEQLDFVRSPAQPFDQPEGAALAAYLHADRRGVDGPSRLRVQVGLQGTERGAGRRPAMNVAVLLDLRTRPGQGSEHLLRSAVEALLDAHDVGDAFSLVTAGPDVAVAPSQFRHGPVSLALDDALAAEGRPVSFDEAFARAQAFVGAGDDPTAPLGSSAVWVLTDSTLPSHAPDLAHRSAVLGIPVSVVQLAGGSSPPSTNREASLQGQGRLRRLAEPGEAETLVENELGAVARVVARAVRLRIRLASGVKLVDVLGSERLDTHQVQRVKAAEKAIDVRISRNLGIQADRGDDEDGLQIVIPAFYAGDHHTVLLDVVAPGPGPVAELQVRYKDLVQGDNGVSRASLDLGHRPAPPGPLERNVFKNLLAWHLGDELAGAADDPSRLEAVAALLRGLTRARSHLAHDPEHQADLALVAWLQSLSRSRTPSLAAALRYAGRRKQSASEESP